MTIKILLLIITSVSLSALAQITMKTGMSGSRIQSFLENEASRFELTLSIIESPYILGGLAMYGLGAILWLFVLARIDVSLAYPFVGLGIILTMVLGFLILGETISLMRIAGTLLVVVGVTLISTSS